MTTCKTCIHEQACDAWIRHGKIFYDDFEYNVENCPHYSESAHGHWNIDTSYMPFLSSCSECGAVYGIDGAFDWDYCPDCGSKMKGYKYGTN